MDYPLTPDQKAIVTAPAEQPLMVLAPPGTGKTHTVIARIIYLVEHEGLRPFELAVLCFSRAAVSEVMNRLRNLIRDEHTHDDLRFVSVRTFDSFATHLLISADPERNLTGFGYDRRIQLAVQSLANPDSMESWLMSNYRHIIVDEIQDLVGDRAELVQAILNCISGGFTLLGDPAQAIYGFASRKGSGKLSSQELLEWVKQQEWVNGLLERNLTENYRSSGQTSDLAEMARGIIHKSENGDQSLAGMYQLLEVLQGAGSGIQPGQMLITPSYDSVCILCRTNGEMLQLASLLASRKIDYYIRPRVEDYGLPAWLGRIFGNYTASRVTYLEFERLWHQLVNLVNQPGPEQSFRWLKKVEGREAPDLDMKILHHRLHRGARLPDEADAFLQPAIEKVALSTIHAAKGREFDHVVVLKPEIRSPIGQDSAEEARILYVAATRARKALSALDRSGLPARIFTVRVENNRRRWVAALRDRNRYFMEVGLPGDVDPLSPVNTWNHPDPDDASKTQEFIWQHVKPGSLLYINKLPRENSGPVPVYLIHPHSSAGLGTWDLARLSLSFSQDLAAVMRYLSRGSRFYYPGYWVTIRVAAVVTEVLPPFPENVHNPYARSGFCLGLRVRGMAYISLE